MNEHMLNLQEFTENIESNYVTDYGAEIGTVFCHIFERATGTDPIRDFFDNISEFDFFDPEKFDAEYIRKTPYTDSLNMMISGIIKETQYNEHFMSWSKGEEYLNLFLHELEGSKTVYTNSGWTKSTSKNSYEKELDLVGYSGISYSYWYDYGFIIVTEKKIGVLWFGDEG
ncbi:hypothetical protein NAT51_15260 [Flavobacterium amniphilum]|uniref:hypothetical protein n=1 Tax=Flavobacterium amniphilum TaxID=1834035 RepID=UPI002029E0AF|nr:hypothetical protein [Flavobacterium amniphilum]MCL9806893.1 hypothetical protein [Flavobacterium amniphilum]